ncbi:MAG: Smr/MutS family protein [Xanthobacteraceae bacterium]
MTGDDTVARRRKLSADERALWGRVTRSLAPLKRRRSAADRGDADAPEPSTKAVPSPRAEPGVTRGPSPAPKPAPGLAPLDRRLKQRLARGTEPIDARLDLHGRTQGEAHAALLRFLRRAQSDGAKFVLVITGKGARAGDASGERGVLKRQVPLWLRLPEFRPYVVGFEDAHIGHGGEGALYVRVRRARAG